MFYIKSTLIFSKSWSMDQKIVKSIRIGWKIVEIFQLAIGVKLDVLQVIEMN